MMNVHANRRQALLTGTLLALSARLAFAQPATPYKIGVTFPLTGTFVVNTHEYVGAMEVAVADVNAAGGIKGHPLSLVIEDSQATPQGGVAAMRKLVQVDGVEAVLTGFTNVVTAQIPLADQLKIPTLSGIESPGVASKSEYSFVHSPTFERIAPLEREYWKAKGIRRIFGLLVNNALGVLASPVVRAAATGAGADYAEAFFDLGQTDYRGIIARAKDFNPEVILVDGGGGADEANMIRQLRELNMTQPLFTVANNFHTRAWREGVGPYAEGMILGGCNVDRSTAPGFVGEYRAKMNAFPGYQPAEYYDLTKILAAAIAAAGYNGEAIRSFVAALKNFPSVMGGTITMGADHYSRPPVALWLVRRGNLVRLSG